MAGRERIFPVRRLTSNSLVAWGEVLQAGFEGYVAKDEASPYVGGATRSWLKVKVPGWTDPEDRWKRVRLETSSTAAVPPRPGATWESGLTTDSQV